LWIVPESQHMGSHVIEEGKCWKQQLEEPY